MKKIFTLILALVGAISVNATETTIWEGTLVAPEWKDHSTVANAKMVEMVKNGSIKEGTKITFYGTKTATDYCSVALIDKDWNSVIDGSVGDDRTVVRFDAEVGVSTTASFDASAITISLIKAGGFYINGHGYTLTKISVDASEPEPGIEDLPAALLWKDEKEISGWGASSLVINEDALTIFTEKLTKECNLYFLVEPAAGSDMRISGMWGDWGDTAYPSGGYNHYSAIDADNVVKVEATTDFVTNAFINGGGFAVWGDGGFKVLAIGTTKSSVLTPTAIDNVADEATGTKAATKVFVNGKMVIMKNGKQYNAAGVIMK